MFHSLVIVLTFALLGPITQILLSELFWPPALSLLAPPHPSLSEMTSNLFERLAMPTLQAHYFIYGIPFLLTGIFCALAARFHRLSLLSAVLAALLAHTLFFSIAFRMYQWFDGLLIAEFVLAALPCWWLVRERPIRWI